MRFFNTSGPVVAADHYCLAPLQRLDLNEILTLLATKRYFVLHAPRQTGKTTVLLALRDLLNSGAAVRARPGARGMEGGDRVQTVARRPACD